MDELTQKLYGILLLIFGIPTAYMLGTLMWTLTNNIPTPVNWFLRLVVTIVVLTGVLVVPTLVFMGRQISYISIIKGYLMLIISIPLTPIITTIMWNLKDIFFTGTLNLIFTFILVMTVVVINMGYPIMTILGADENAG